jgi:putative peptide zinc metalloprotease protein
VAQGQQVEQVQVEVPEKPKLADDITLKGEMQESAFVDPPWLIERDGGYIQLPKLLYHVAEQCTGDQTHEQMAEAVGQKLGRKVTADNIKVLVGKLIPMGIVDVPGLPESAKKRGSVAGALSVNAKMLRIPPRVFTPVSHLLQVFYIKPVLVLTLLLTFAAEGWMFFVHGIGGGIHDALYTPGLLVAVFGLVVVATAFHEFGHASALQHGGGTVGEMGAGIYIAYPAFYTDVTDNYRLPRWARVRTDLGGIYFSLIFSLALMALYVATDSAFLLMVVLFINFEIFHNLLPFVRLDGYWTLADITGIPDFFSMIAPYCRSHVPFKWLPLPKGKECPELKTWAKWVFGLYVAITVPLLAFLLFMMIVGVPRILATFVDAAWKQVGNIGNSWGTGDYLGVAAAAGQMLLLALPTCALLFTLFNLGKKAVVGLWNWGKKSPLNGVLASLGSVAALLLLLFLWSPSLLLSLFVKGGAPDRGPLQDLMQFRPIDRQERFAVGDIVTGQVVTVTRKSGLAMFGLDFGSSSTVTTTATVTATTTVTASNVLTITATPRPLGSATRTVIGTPRTGTPTVAITTTTTPVTSTAILSGTATSVSGSPVASVAPSITSVAGSPTALGTARPGATVTPGGVGGTSGTVTAAAQATNGTLPGGPTVQTTTGPATATPTKPPASSGTTVPPGASTPTTSSGSGSTPVAPAPTAATQPTANTAPTATPPVSQPPPSSTPVPASTQVVQPTPAPPRDTPVVVPTSTPIPTFTAAPTSTSTPTPTYTPVAAAPTQPPQAIATATNTAIVQGATPVTNTPATATSVPPVADTPVAPGGSVATPTTGP